MQKEGEVVKKRLIFKLSKKLPKALPYKVFYTTREAPFHIAHREDAFNAVLEIVYLLQRKYASFTKKEVLDLELNRRRSNSKNKRIVLMKIIRVFEAKNFSFLRNTCKKYFTKVSLKEERPYYRKALGYLLTYGLGVPINSSIHKNYKNFVIDCKEKCIPMGILNRGRKGKVRRPKLEQESASVTVEDIETVPTKDKVRTKIKTKKLKVGRPKKEVSEEEAPKVKDTKKKAKKAPKAKKEKASSKKKGEMRPGTISAYVDSLLSSEKGVTKETLIEKCIKKFSDKDPAKLANSVSVLFYTVPKTLGKATIKDKKGRIRYR